MTTYNSFEELAQARIEWAEDRAASAYASAFIEHNELAKLSIMDEPVASQMPDPDMACRAVEMAIGTIFDVLKDTRMEEFAQQIAWGVVNSFHMTATLAERREDDAARKLGELARQYDPSEIYAVELEETQLLCQTLQGCREALEAMRDHASAIYHVETGKVFRSTRGSQVARTSVTASQINARDYLASRAKQRRADHTPEGPVVVVSGGQQDWYDYEMLWGILDDIRTRIPNMVLASTGMRKGVDAMANAWSANNGITIVNFAPERKHGKRAAFLRNDALVKLSPVEAIVCEGSGIQSHLAQNLRRAGVPLHLRQIKDQRPGKRRTYR